MNIAVAGAGYVGLSLAVLLAQNEEVKIFTTTSEKADLINAKVSPIKDNDISIFFITKKLKIKATNNISEAYKNAEYIVIATPTDYDKEAERFDTSSIEDVIEKAASVNPAAVFVIKSTVPIRYTESLIKKYNCKIMFSPEFLREGRALHDNLYPERIIIGVDKNEEMMCRAAEKFAAMLKKGAVKGNIPVLLTGTAEAEAIKLFANTYLAMRVAFFNELDTYAEIHNMDSKDIIDGVCMDTRIGQYYNNPSFGYGGYCLPKDTKQIAAEYNETPNDIIKAVVRSNDTRKKHIAACILKAAEKQENESNKCVIGIYHIAMKKDSDNHRESSIIDIIDILRKSSATILIYDHDIGMEEFLGIRVTDDLEKFKTESTIIVANRSDDELTDVNEKVYTRDVYVRD